MKKILILFLYLFCCYADDDYECKNNDLNACYKVIKSSPSPIDFCQNVEEFNYKKTCAEYFYDITRVAHQYQAKELRDKLYMDFPKVCIDFIYAQRHLSNTIIEESLSMACEIDYIKACDLLVEQKMVDNVKYVEKSCNAGNYNACVELEYIKLKNNNLALAETECLQNNNCEKAFNEGTKNQEILLKLCENKKEKACLRYAELNASENNGKYDEYSLKACEINVNVCMQKAKFVEQFLQFDFEGNIKTLKRYYEIACEKGLDIACEEFKRVEALNPDDYKFDGKVKTIRIKF